MNKISKYDEFLLEKEFNSIVFEFFRLVEELEGKWTEPRTIEWNYTKKETPEEINQTDKIFDFEIDSGGKALTKLQEFLKKLPKEKIREYYIKLVNKLKSLPDVLRKKLLVGITGVFLTFVSITYLLSTSTDSSNKIFTGGGLDSKQTEEIIEITKSIEDKTPKASFEKAQKLIKLAEAGYSDDRGDNGNYINVRGGRRFIGTNHGISAPILANYFKRLGIKRLITKEDMMNLSYKTALKIYKKDYWDRQHLGEIQDQNVANLIYDGCVNQGVDGMKSVIRDALEENGVVIQDTDVIFSKEILSKANKVGAIRLFDSIKKFREERYKESETFNKHGEGWMNRLDNISYNSEESSKDS